jgi:hypothetical protein
VVHAELVTADGNESAAACLPGREQTADADSFHGVKLVVEFHIIVVPKGGLRGRAPC